MKLFHSFRLDPVNQCLWRGDRRVAITPKAFDVLRYLVEHPGRLVTQGEMLEALWPKAYVNPEVIKKYILAARKALEDKTDHPLFIQTVPRRGYQFVAAVSEHVADGTAATSGTKEERIVGRDGELARLDALLGKALRGQRQIIFVTGDPGIGKTALVDTFQQRALRRGNMRVARGQCVEGFGGKEAYYPMLEALGQMAGGRAAGPLVQTLAARAPTWLIQFPSLVKATQREALHREILGATRERMLREICEALESLTVSDALIVVFEDLHWVDPSTLDLLSALARRREPAKLAIVATYRPHDVALAHSPLKSLKRDLLLHGLCEEIALDRLATTDVGRYLAAKFSDALPSGLARVIHRHSAGNPLFMVAIVQDMQKKGWIVQDAGTWKLAASLERIDPGIPETLQQMLDAQFAQLSAPEQEVLKAASVAGERFSTGLISATLEVPSEQIEGLCEGLAERRQFIAASLDEPSGEELTANYEFSHSLYREGVYRRLSAMNRSRLHRKVAEKLLRPSRPDASGQELAAQLARHFEHGRDYPRAIEYLLKAAENAGRRFAYRESIRILQHALELLPSLPADTAAALECRIQELIGDGYYALGAMTESAASYQASASRAAQAGLCAAQVTALGCLVRPLGLIDPDRGIAAVDEAARLGCGVDDPLLVARTSLTAAATRLFYDTWRTADALRCAAAHEALRRLGDDGASYHEMIYGHILALEGHYDDAIATFDRVADNLDASPSLIAYFFALSGKTVALLRCGRIGEVLRIIREGQRAAAKNGNDPWLLNFREAWLRMLVFDYDGAVELCRTMLTSDAEYPTAQPRAIANVCEACADLARGNFGRAIECFGKVAAPRSTEKFFLHWIWRITAQLGLFDAWLASGNLENASDASELLVEATENTADPHFRALAWDAKARLSMRSQAWTEARGFIDRAFSALENFAVPMAAWQIHATASEWHAHTGDSRAAKRHRASAERHIRDIADSLSSGEPLRASFLDAAPVRKVLADATAKGLK